MHHGTCVTHVPWCMSGSLTRGGGETFPAFTVHAQPAILQIWQEARGQCLGLCHLTPTRCHPWSTIRSDNRNYQKWEMQTRNTKERQVAMVDKNLISWLYRHDIGQNLRFSHKCLGKQNIKKWDTDNFRVGEYDPGPRNNSLDSNMRLYSFSPRIYKQWSNLPDWIVDAKSVVSFERYPDKLWRTSDVVFKSC